jgi:hypothetical protein
MWRRVALVRTDVPEELSASIIRLTRIGELGTTELSSSIIRLTIIGELGTTLAVTSNRSTLRRNTASVASYG